MAPFHSAALIALYIFILTLISVAIIIAKMAIVQKITNANVTLDGKERTVPWTVVVMDTAHALGGLGSAMLAKVCTFLYDALLLSLMPAGLIRSMLYL